jgi:hypothetical protein
MALRTRRTHPCRGPSPLDGDGPFVSGHLQEWKPSLAGLPGAARVGRTHYLRHAKAPQDWDQQYSGKVFQN